MSWPTATLSDLTVSAAAGFACGESDPEGIAQIRMNNVGLDGSINFEKVRRVPRTAAPVERYLLQPDDVLFNATNSPELVGKTALATELPEPFVYSNHFIRIRTDQSKLLPSYLAKWLTAQQQAGRFELMCNKWVNQASVRREDLLALRIPLPPLSEQRRIAAILDKADALRAKRREAIAKLDQLLQAVFLDMFGDPVTNPKEMHVTEVGTISTCIVPGRDKPKSFTGTIPWVTTDDLNDLGVTCISRKRAALTVAEVAEVRARIIPRNSVVMSCVGDLGVTSIAGSDIVVNQQLHTFQCGASIVPEFLMYCLSMRKDFMKARATSTTLPYMNKSVCNSIPVLLPLLSEQRHFAEICRGVWKDRERSLASLESMDALQSSLANGAFQAKHDL